MDRIAGAIIISALIIGAAIYLRPEPQQPRYQIYGAARLDTLTGEIVTCSTSQGCRTFMPKETDLERDLRNNFK